MLFPLGVKHLMLVALVTSACASSVDGDPGADPADPGGKGDQPGGSGSNGPFVEASHASQPIVMSQGGNVLAAPKVDPNFFAGDGTMQPQVETFLTQLAASPYWPAITAEYGVGALAITPSIVTADPPPTTDAALQTWIQSHAGVDWPANDADTIYSVFLPAGITLTASFGTSCAAFGGFHEETPDGTIVYALLPRCDDAIDDLTVLTSHELLEAASDPHPYTKPAFNIVDDEDVMWEVAPGARARRHVRVRRWRPPAVGR